MGSQKIRRSLKEERRERRRVHAALAAGRSSYVTVLRNPDGEILGVLADRSGYDRFKAKCATRGIDLTQAELFDYELEI